MNFVFVFALPWALFALAYAAYHAARSLFRFIYSGLVHRKHARFCIWSAWFNSRARNHKSEERRSVRKLRQLRPACRP